LGAWFKEMLSNSEQYEPLLPGQPEDGERYTMLDSIRDVRSDYEWFFNELPTLTSDSDWQDFISQVNNGRSGASDFYFDPNMQSHLQH